MINYCDYFVSFHTIQHLVLNSCLRIFSSDKFYPRAARNNNNNKKVGELSIYSSAVSNKITDDGIRKSFAKFDKNKNFTNNNVRWFLFVTFIKTENSFSSFIVFDFVIHFYYINFSMVLTINFGLNGCRHSLDSQSCLMDHNI